MCAYGHDMSVHAAVRNTNNPHTMWIYGDYSQLKGEHQKPRLGDGRDPKRPLIQKSHVSKPGSLPVELAGQL